MFATITVFALPPSESEFFGEINYLVELSVITIEFVRIIRLTVYLTACTSYNGSQFKIGRYFSKV